MSTTKKKTAKDSIVMYLAIAFIAGFISGAGFAVFKLGPSGPSDAPAPTTQTQAPGQQQSNMSEQQRLAIANLEKEVTQAPEKFQSWTQLGNLYFDTAQYPKAVKAYEKSLSLHSGTADIWTDLGVMYRRTGDSKKAIEAFEKAIEMNPTHETSRLNKGIVLFYDFKDSDAAIESWENLLKVNPNARSSSGESIKDFVDQIKADMAKQKSGN